MTAPITLEEYKKDPAKVEATVFNLNNALRAMDTSGANPTIKEIQPQIRAIRDAAKPGVSTEVYLAEVNKYIALLDNTLKGPSLSSEQKSEINRALAFVTEGREGAKPQAGTDNSFKKAPNELTPEQWAANDKAIVAAANEAIAGLAKVTDPEIRRLVGLLQADLTKTDRTGVHGSLLRLQKAISESKDPALKSIQDKLDAVAKPITENSRANNGKTMEPPPKAAEPPPKPTPAAGKLCEPITHERWGVRFRFLDKPPEKQGECETKGDGKMDLKDWFLQLLPAMQSVVPRQGARDVPNAGPGLSFRFKNNMVKHKIPGSQPVYQMMGVDSAIITFVGTFTGDGGLGYINKVDIEDGEIAENSLRMLEREAASRRAGEKFPDAKKYGGVYPYGKKEVNAMFNPIYHVRNRARAPGGDTSSALVGSNSTGWLMDNSILRQGFFERDGCPGQCPPPSWGNFPNGHMDEAGGRFAWGDFGTWPDGTPYGDVGTRSQMDTHKLAHIAAYLDAYHEMVSFYKFAVQAGKLMEITINLRKTHDGLKPRVADPRMKGKLKSDTPDPLRDMHTGNPTFKGYLRTMSTWAQYSDRVWYVMEFEVMDHGLQGKKAVNLTNKVKAGGPSSGGGGGGAEEAPGSTGSDDPPSEGGSAEPSAANSTPGKSNVGGEPAVPPKQALIDTLSEDKTLPTKDGEALTLGKDGIIRSADGKTTLSYEEAESRLNFYDLVGKNTLQTWFSSNRVIPYAGSIEVRNRDGTTLALRNDGTVLEYSKGDTKGKPADPKVLNSISSGIGGLNDQQKAAIIEWRDKYYKTEQVAPVPSTVSAPIIPAPTPQPINIEKLGPPLPPTTSPFNASPFTTPTGPTTTAPGNVQIPRNTSPPGTIPDAVPPPGLR